MKATGLSHRPLVTCSSLSISMSCIKMIFDDTLYKVHDTFPVMIDPDELNLMSNLNSNLDFVLADSIIILQSSCPGFLHFPNKFPYMQAGNN